jgi:DNA-directed RNA polymerase subunit L
MMNPIVENETTDDFNTLKFTLSGVNVSFANAIRRTLLSDIPVVIFKTMPHEENLANFITNTSRMNNELLKQRLSCVPIHLNPDDLPLDRLLLEVDVTNETDSVMYVTTEHFKIRDIQTGKYLPQHKLDDIFPPFVPNGNAKYYIDFVRLRPRISDEIPGEKLKFTCKFAIGSARIDACFNVVGTCAYGCSVDKSARDIALAKKIQELADAGESKAAIDFQAKNWVLLDGMRFIKQDSFDFILQSVCLYSNEYLMVIACNVLIHKLQTINELLDADTLEIEPSKNTMNNCYDITLKNEDYTVGKILEFMLYTKFFENMKILSYCGFKKMHPHDTDSIIRVAYKNPIDKSGIKLNLHECATESIEFIHKIRAMFATNAKKNNQGSSSSSA